MMLFAMEMNDLNSFRKIVFRVALFALILTMVITAPAQATKIKITTKIKGAFLTTVAGSSTSQPPYIQVIRSREGLDYLLGRFKKHKSRVTRNRLKKLERKLSKVNFEKYMVVGVFSKPMDNFKMKISNATIDTDEKMIELKVTYQHKIRTYQIPPKKSIHYLIAVIEKSDYPVILQATQLVASKKKNAPPEKVVTVTGRLMPLSGANLQLVPVVIRRGKKNSYYIRGAQTETLEKHVGKVITLQGTVSHERNSPYEWDFTVNKVVKIFN